MTVLLYVVCLMHHLQLVFKLFMPLLTSKRKNTEEKATSPETHQPSLNPTNKPLPLSHMTLLMIPMLWWTWQKRKRRTKWTPISTARESLHQYLNIPLISSMQLSRTNQTRREMQQEYLLMRTPHQHLPEMYINTMREPKSEQLNCENRWH